MTQLRDHLLRKCGADTAKRAELEAYFSVESNRGPLGLLLNERAVNLPPQLVPPLHRCLFEEVEKLAEVVSHNLFFFFCLLLRKLTH